MWIWLKRAAVTGGFSLWLVAGIAFAQQGGADKPDSKNNTTAAKVDIFIHPKTLAELLALPDSELEEVDFTIINLLCAESLLGSETLNVQDNLDTLKQWTWHVKQETERNYHRFIDHPEAYNNSEGEFRMGMLVTVVQQDLKIHYSTERAEPQLRGKWESNDRFYADSRDIFMHGLLSGNRNGTCSSIPVLYVAIARRLGYPVSLARTKRHFYVRYEEDGKHLNIEGSGEGYNVYTDDFYKKWPFPVTDEEIGTFGFLRAISKKEALGDFLANRALCLKSASRFNDAADCWKQVARYLPLTPALATVVDSTEKRAKIERDAQAWDSLWAELDKEQIPYGPKSQFYNDWKLQTQMMMTRSTDLSAISKAVTDYKASFKQYRNEISDNPLASASPAVPEMKGPSPFRENEMEIADATPLPRRIYIAREKIPSEYFWNGIPSVLQQRLQKFRTEDEVVEEMHLYAAEEASLRNLENQEHMRNLSSGFVSPGFVPKEEFDLRELGIRPEDLPYDLRSMSIPPDLQKRLAGTPQNTLEGKKDSIMAEMRRFKVDQDQNRKFIEAINARRHLIDNEMAHTPMQIVVVDSPAQSSDQGVAPERSQIPQLTIPSQTQNFPSSGRAEKP